MENSEHPNRRLSIRFRSRADPQAELPGYRTERRHHAATLARRRQGQRVRFAVGRLDGQMVMPVPSAASQPQAERVVFGWIPFERQTVTGASIINRGETFAQERRGNTPLFAVPSGSLNAVRPPIYRRSAARAWTRAIPGHHPDTD